MKPKHKHAKKSRKGKPPAKPVYFMVYEGWIRLPTPRHPGFSVTV